MEMEYEYLKECKSLLFLDEKDLSYLSMNGIQLFKRNDITFNTAQNLIIEVAKAIKSAPKYQIKKLKAIHNQIILGFGPDMEKFYSLLK